MRCQAEQSDAPRRNFSAPTQAVGRKDRLTQQVQEDSTAILSVAVGSKVHLPLTELLQQLLAGARQLDAHTLHAVAKLGADSFHNGNGAILVQVHLQVECR